MDLPRVNLPSAETKRRLLIGAGAVVAAIVVATLVWWLAPSLFGPHGSKNSATEVTATVTNPVACDAANPHDQVSFTINGQQQQARLDGCGNAQNSTVQVMVPPSVNGDTVLTEAQTGIGGDYRRLGFVLLVVGGLAGAAYAFLFWLAKPTPQPAESPEHEPEPA